MTLHIIHSDDLIEHEKSDDCPCGPATEPIKHEDGYISWIVTHHSLDGREKNE